MKLMKVNRINIDWKTINLSAKKSVGVIKQNIRLSCTF